MDQADSESDDEVVISLEIDGEMQDFKFQGNTPSEEILRFVDSKMPSSHPESTIPAGTDGIRMLCRMEGCETVAVFETMPEVEESGWTKIESNDGILSDMDNLNYALCPDHSETSSV